MKANEATGAKDEAGDDGDESNLPGGEDIDLLCGLGCRPGSRRLGSWLGSWRLGSGLGSGLGRGPW